MSGFNWLNIRSYNGSQNNAFEELVCQLARTEEISGKSNFIRVGAPDGGVEAYCTLINGAEYGWQAKYFTHQMGQVQWKELSESYKTALTKHPNLIKYYICIPMDRHDPRIPKQKWFMDKWDDNVKEWKKIACDDYGRDIEFEYWGSSELLDRLLQNKNVGIRQYWFDSLAISDEWLSEMLDRNISSLGERYSPELNLQLDIAKVFEGIAREIAFYEGIRTLNTDVQKKIRKALWQIRGVPGPISAKAEQVRQRTEELQNGIEKIRFAYSEMLPIDFGQLDAKCTLLGRSLMGFVDEIEIIKQLKGTGKEKQDKSSVRSKNDDLAQAMQGCIDQLHELQDLFHGPTTQLVNTPVMVLCGEAGVGKSHLIADVALSRQNSGKSVLLFLGQHFRNDDAPWNQILRNQLGISATADEFLGVLNAKAQSQNCRIIVFIDAINEGRGKYFWNDHMWAFIHSFQKYKWLGLVLSVRASYEEIVIPRDIYSKKNAIRVVHDGFAGVEYEAAQRFFDTYNIIQPSIPFLHPEFQNPLFLKLFCEGLHKAGLKTIPDGFDGITKIIDFYISAINKRLSDPCRLNYSNKLNLVHLAIHAVVGMQVERQCQYISYAEANLIVGQAVQHHTEHYKCFLDELVNEGVFSLNMFWTASSSEEGVYFAYERFSDHIAVSYLLNKCLDRDNPDRSFQPGTILHRYIKDSPSRAEYKGIIEALSIQLPECVGKDLFEFVEEIDSDTIIAEAFIYSLLWRKVDTIHEKILSYINRIIFSNTWLQDLFFDTVLQVSPNPRHFFNGDRLHANLMRRSLCQRDAWWTIYINQNYREQTAIKRLVDWAFTSHDRSFCSDESCRLIGITMSWFLTSSNRPLRDKTTKALVCLFQERIEALIEVLRAFEEVNDPYVYERLFAVAYGCALRTSRKNILPQLCRYVFDTIFAKKLVYPHILLRDYARNTIEYTVSMGLETDIDLTQIRPPYRSEWYQTIPTLEEIDRAYKHDYRVSDFKDEYWAQENILDSMTTEYGRGTGRYGDFGRYTFQAAVDNWQEQFDPQELSNIATLRVFELGYDVELHGYYDRNKREVVDRHSHVVERIGKKYQWLAFHELLAKLSDHYPMSEVDYSQRDIVKVGDLEFDMGAWLEHLRAVDSGDDTKIISVPNESEPKRVRKYTHRQYEGPWDPFVRDIDPSVTMFALDKSNNFLEDKFEIPEENLDEWVHDFTAIPSFDDVFHINRHEQQFVLLSSHLKWLTRHDNENYKDREELFIKTTGLFVPANKVAHYAASRQVHEYSYGSHWGSNYQVFGKEYYWSPAFNSVAAEGTKRGKLLPSTFEYLWEKEYDHSIERSLSYLIPSTFLTDSLELSQDNYGYWRDKSGKLICYDMALEGFNTALIIERGSLENLLNTKKLALIWDVYLEKIANEELHEWRFVMGMNKRKLRKVHSYGEDTWPLQ